METDDWCGGGGYALQREGQVFHLTTPITSFPPLPDPPLDKQRPEADTPPPLHSA